MIKNGFHFPLSQGDGAAVTSGPRVLAVAPLTFTSYMTWTSYTSS